MSNTIIELNTKEQMMRQLSVAELEKVGGGISTDVVWILYTWINSCTPGASYCPK